MLLVRSLALADFLSLADNVQNVILNLERQADRGGVTIQLRQRRSPGFAGAQRAQAHRRADQRAGFVAVDLL